MRARPPTLVAGAIAAVSCKFCASTRLQLVVNDARSRAANRPLPPPLPVLIKLYIQKYGRLHVPHLRSPAARGVLLLDRREESRG